MAPQNPPGGPQHGGRLAAWVRHHKGAAVALGAGAAVGLLVLAKRGAASTSAAASATGSADGPGTSATVPASVYGGGTDTSGLDSSMQNLADALNGFTASQSGGGGVTSGGTGAGSGGGGVTLTGHTGDPGKTVNPNAKSWTDTGQKWSLAQLARALGVPLSALKPSNAQGSKGAANPQALLAKGASFTYVQTPAQAAAGVKPVARKTVLKPPITVRKSPV